MNFIKYLLAFFSVKWVLKRIIYWFEILGICRPDSTLHREFIKVQHNTSQYIIDAPKDLRKFETIRRIAQIVNFFFINGFCISAVLVIQKSDLISPTYALAFLLVLLLYYFYSFFYLFFSEQDYRTRLTAHKRSLYNVLYYSCISVALWYIAYTECAIEYSDYILFFGEILAWIGGAIITLILVSIGLIYLSRWATKLILLQFCRFVEISANKTPDDPFKLIKAYLKLLFGK